MGYAAQGGGIRACRLSDFLELFRDFVEPATYKTTASAAKGRKLFERIECGSCHIANLPVSRDRRVYDVETKYDPQRGLFNNLYATANALFDSIDDRSGFPLVLFPPDDTASNLNPGDRKAAGFPQYGHGSIKLGALFNDPNDPE